MDRKLVTGLILAGGEARRMDGDDKGLVVLRGRPLVAHALDRFAPQVGGGLISANRNRDAYAALGWPVVADVVEGYAGPLAGLHAGLQACTTPLLAVVPCDAPLLPNDLVPRLAEALAQRGASIAAARAGERIHPTFLLCRREVRAELEAYLAGGGRRMQEWLALMGGVTVPFADADAFANVNTRADLDRLEAAPSSAAS